MNIAIVSDTFPPEERGGAAIVALREAHALVASGHHVRVFTSGAAIGCTQEDGVEVHRLGPYKARGRWEAAFGSEGLDLIRQSLESFHPDVVHAHHVTHFFGLRVMDWITSRYRTVVTAHDATWMVTERVFIKEDSTYGPSLWEEVRTYRHWYNPFFAPYAARILNRIHALIFVSDALRNAYAQRFPLRCTTVTEHNALNLKEWPMAPFQDQDPIVLGFAGRASIDKGWRLFGELLGEINRLGMPVIGVYAGSADAFARASAELPPSQRHLIRHDGDFRTDIEIQKWYGSVSAMFVGSLKVDPYPNVGIEAIASGRGVIAGPYTGTAELVHASKKEVGIVLTPTDLKNTARIASLLAQKPFMQWSQNTAFLRPSIDMRPHLERLLRLYQGQDID